MTSWTAGIVALSSLRLQGAEVAFFAALMALVFVVQRRSRAGAPPPRKGMLIPALIALPITTPIAACLMTALAVPAAALLFDCPIGKSWERVQSFVTLRDPLFGAGMAAVFALVFGGVAPVFGRSVARGRAGIVRKAILVLVVTLLISTVVNAALARFFPLLDDSLRRRLIDDDETS